MNRTALDKRMRELSIYSDFYYRKELGALAQVIQDGEQLNCILTGVHEGNRKMLAITDQRVIILFAGALAREKRDGHAPQRGEGVSLREKVPVLQRALLHRQRDRVRIHQHAALA